MSRSPRSILRRSTGSARDASPISNTMSSAGPGAPPCSGPLSAPIAPVDGRHEIGARRDDDARGERRRVEAVIGHRREIGLEPAHELRMRLSAAQHVQVIRREPESSRAARAAPRRAAGARRPRRSSGTSRRAGARPRASSAARRVPAAMRSASIGVDARAQPRRAATSSVAAGTARPRARARRDWPAASQSSATTSSNARPAICSRRSPATISSPRSPSTMLRRVLGGDDALEPAVRATLPFAFSWRGKVSCNVPSRSILIVTINMTTSSPSGSMRTRPRTLLGVSHATLYAYVSRGRIRSESAPGSRAPQPLLARRRRAAARAHARAAQSRNGGRAGAALGATDPRVVDHVDRRRPHLLPRPRRGGARALRARSQTWRR